MSTTYGLTSTGFTTKPQSQILAEIQQSMRNAFGNSLNFSDTSILQQLAGINSEREALIWQLAEAVYASQYPSGAEGTSVDNILALTNLKRDGATPTRTNTTPLTQSNGITLYGLVLEGTPGTVIPALSIIQNQASPPLSFLTDALATIQPASNAVQSLYLSNTPTTGSYSLSIDDVDGNTLTTPLIPYNAIYNAAQLSWASVPSIGGYKIALTSLGQTLSTTTLTYNSTAAQIQTAIQALSGYSSVTVSGNYTSGFTITYPPGINPTLAVTNNTTSVVVSEIDSIQSAFNQLYDSSETSYPYTDVAVSQSGSGYNFLFGSFSPATSQPSSGAQPQALMLVVTNTMMMNTSVTNLNIVNTTVGAPAQAVTSATCTVDGVNFVAAGTLTVIGSSISGWTGVNNQLDCITGTTLEDDTTALIRRSNNFQGNANGPLQATVEKVRAVTDVVTAIGFENLNGAALQVIEFSLVPSSGSFQIVLNGVPTASIPYTATSSAVQSAVRAVSGYANALVSGSFAADFTLDFNGSFGGQEQPLIGITANSLGVTVTTVFGRPGHSIEIVVEGGADLDIANTIFTSKPGGIQTYGTVSQQVFDNYGNPYTISFSRPTVVPIYVTIVLETDLTTATTPTFIPGSVNTIQQDIVSIGNEVSIGGLIIGFGTDGLIGAFNSVPGILNYTLYFGRSPNPTQNVNIQLQPEEVPSFQTFLTAVSYT